MAETTEQDAGAVRRRPGGRTARTGAAVHAAAIAQLSERGYRGVTVDGVARAAGVHPATVYRRWGGVDGILQDVASEVVATSLPVPDTGSFDADVESFCVALQRTLTQTPAGDLVQAMVAAATADELAAGLLSAFILERHETVAAIVRRAQRRGEVSDATEPGLLMEDLGGRMYFRLLLTREPLTDDYAHLLARSIAVAARAGAFEAAPDSVE